jgi:type IV secretion system protein VirB2
MRTDSDQLNSLWQASLLVLLAAFVVLLPDFAHATNTRMGNVLCTAALWFTGNTGKGLATVAITVIGIGALLGKVSWGMAMIVGIGVAIVFGASQIVSTMGAGAGGGNIATGCATTAA